MALASEETLREVADDLAGGITATLSSGETAGDPVFVRQSDGTNPITPAKDSTVASLRKYAGAVAVTPNDGSNLAVEAAGIFVGTGGTTLKIRTYGADGTTPGDITFTNVPNGTLLPLPVIKVYATGTDADDLVAVY
jgi:hypothetical protein